MPSNRCHQVSALVGFLQNQLRAWGVGLLKLIGRHRAGPKRDFQAGVRGPAMQLFDSSKPCSKPWPVYGHWNPRAVEGAPFEVAPPRDGSCWFVLIRAAMFLGGALRWRR
jgi:hypothetical protein